MITMSDALKLIEERREDAIVLPTMTGSGAWAGISRNQSFDLPVSGGMGKASSIALGVALAQPEKKVIVVDGDGSLLMNLGSLVTIGGKAPENLYHFVINNGVYAVTGGQPVPNADNFTFAGIAEGAGYAASFEFDDFEEFATSLDDVMRTKGPVMIALKSEPVIDTGPVDDRIPARRTPAAMKDLKQALNG